MHQVGPVPINQGGRFEWSKRGVYNRGEEGAWWSVAAVEVCGCGAHCRLAPVATFVLGMLRVFEDVQCLVADMEARRCGAFHSGWKT